MSAWVPLHVHTHYSLLKGLSKPEAVAARCEALGYKACAITDHGTLSGTINFSKALRKKNIKPILGCEFYLSQQDSRLKNQENGIHSRVCVLAKGDEGWKRLVRASSSSNNPDNFYKKPRLDLPSLGRLMGGHGIAFSGHPGSDLCNALFSDARKAYEAHTYEEARNLVPSDWESRLLAVSRQYQVAFGPENFWVEIQAIDQDNLPAAAVAVKALRCFAKKHNLKTLATPDAHYPTREDASDQRVLMAISLQSTLPSIRSALAKDEDSSLGAFFRSNRYHIPSLQEIQALHQPEEIESSLVIADLCGDVNVLGSPQLPEFACPKGVTADDHLRQLCREGWRKKLPWIERGSSDYQTYGDRVNMELAVIMEAGLSPYFLIVGEYCGWARSNGWLVGKGRGSGAGCLISYLLNITNVDPVKYRLLFERFYNAGRNQPGRVSLPDIDCDFPISHRDEVVHHMRDLYGNDKVAQMVTFSRLQGRAAIKDVMKVHEKGTFDEVNCITDHIPDEAAIADELQEMREDTGEASIIQWALENNSKGLAPWCRLLEDGTLEGPLATEFAQAIRLEGTKRNQGKHAAGVVIAPRSLTDCCPMVYDKSTQRQICGVEMVDLEAMGFVKFDILGVAALDKIQSVVSLLKGGKSRGE
jgi:DNA polymerase-3 subunit alpha